jgi:NTP pyrophosphatase (non-canonical NTP hydrolase)
MNLKEYQALSSRTATNEEHKPQAFCNYALGLNGEAGEVADMIKKGIFHGHELDRHEVAKELGDCLWYIAQLSRLAGFTLEDVAVMNINKLKARYPNGFSEEASVKRNV